MTETGFNVAPFIRSAKQMLLANGQVERRFADVRDAMAKEIDDIVSRQANSAIVPEIDFKHVENGTVAQSDIAEVRKRGCLIVRNVFPRQLAEDWNEELGHYLARNRYFDRAREKAGLDNYFGDLKDATPQIFGVYWSRPQIMARQAEAMAKTKRFLNRLWDASAPAGPEFNPDLDYSYADRTRRRAPGDTTLGLSPHMDAGSYERWVDPAFQRIYEDIFSGRCDRYDPWRAAYRTQTREFASPAVSSMFRTFQGWTALTEQGPGDGTLELLPSSRALGYILLRSLLDDIPEDELCRM